MAGYRAILILIFAAALAMFETVYDWHTNYIPAIIVAIIGIIDLLFLRKEEKTSRPY